MQLRYFCPFPGENLPEEIRAKLDELAKNKQLSLDKEGSNYTVAVYYNPKDKTLGIYPPQALPHKVTGEGGDAIRVINAEDLEEGAKLLTEHLFHLARVSRLMALDFNEDKLKVDMTIYEGETPVTRPTTDGVPLLQDGDKLTLTFKNETNKSLYVSIFYISPKQEAELFYPLPEDAPIPIKPGEEYEFDEVGIEVDGKDDAGRCRIKLIATSEFTDFNPLIKTPATGIEQKTRGKIRGADDPLYDMMSDVLHGSEETNKEKTRAKRVRSKATWATSSVVVDVAPLD